MIKKILLSSLFISSVLMTACTTISTPNSDTKVNSAISITDKTWVVTHINGEAITTKPTDRNIPSLLLDSKQKTFSGADGCNRIMGGYNLVGNQLAFGQMAGSMMACLDTDIQRISHLYTTTLGQVSTYQLTANTLILKDKSGKSILQFTSAVQPR